MKRRPQCLLSSMIVMMACGGRTELEGGRLAAGVGGATAVRGSEATGGTSATGGISTTGGTYAIGNCVNSSDCHLLQNCCSCAAVSNNTTAECLLSCGSVSMCDGMGLGPMDAICVAGRCSLSLSCNTDYVTCLGVPPKCNPGQVPAIRNGCFDKCIAVDQCNDVTSCNDCEAWGLACVTVESPLGSLHHCVTTPRACEQNRTCECMGVCDGIYACVNPGTTDLTCRCVECMM